MCSLTQNITKNWNYTKTKSFEGNYVFYSFLRTEINLSTPFVFLEIDPEGLHIHVFYMPIPRHELRSFFILYLFIYLAETFWPKVGHIFQKLLTEQTSNNKKRNTTGEVFAMGQKRRRVQNSAL